MNCRKYSIAELNLKLPPNTRLRAIEYSNLIEPSGKKVPSCLFLCKCGQTKNIPTQSAITGNTLSCGCYAAELLKNNTSNKKYSHTIPALRNVYQGMMERCYNKKHKSYKYYGGNGVTVCLQWRKSYQNFLNWALANGWKRGLKLDKDIKGTGKLYSPSKCCFVTHRENVNHTSSTVWYEHNGKKMSLADICREEGMKTDIMYMRRHRHPKATIIQLLSNIYL
jgi:hypothetical protein